MKNKLISFILLLCLLIAIPLSARYKYNPFTRKLDYYETGADIDLGDLADITLTGLATGNILYYNGTAWVNLATGANTNVLTLAAGIPSWAAPGAPAAHAATHLAAGADSVDHDLLLNYLAAQHLTLPSTIAAVLTDHTQAAHNALLIDADTVDGEHAAAIVTNARVKAHFPDTIANILSDHNLLAHTALGLFDQSSDVDHNATTNYVANQHINWTAAASNFSTSEDFFLTWTEAADHAEITQSSAAGIENQPLIYIEDERTGATVDEAIEASLRINADGPLYAFYIEDGDALLNNIAYFAGDTYQYEDVFITWADALDHAVITQSAVAGTEDQPLIFINDDRTGVTVDEVGEATIVMDADGVYAMYFLDGTLAVASTSQLRMINSTIVLVGGAAYLDVSQDGGAIDYGASHLQQWWDGNGAGDDLHTWVFNVAAANDTAAIFMSSLNPTAMTDHDDYASATFVLANDEGADANDYAGVVIGERGQADVKVAHYFDFYAMVGATDGVVDPSNAELAAIFRFGASGSLTPVYATTPGDVYIEGAFEVNDKYRMDTTNHVIMLGDNAGENLTIGSGVNNILIGDDAGNDLTTGDNNVMVGYQAGTLQTTASGSTFVGHLAGSATVDGARNTAIGYQAFVGGGVDGNTQDNVAVGAEALFSLGEASAYNTAVGNFALRDITDEASRNTAVGYQAGYDTGGDAEDNVYVGYNAGYGTGASAGGNVVVGSQAMEVITGAINNVAIGAQAGAAMTSGDRNVIVGYQAAEDITTGQDNVVIGYMAGEGWLDAETNLLVIDNTDTATPLIYGDFSADNITINGDFNVTMDAALDQIAITQTNVTGTDNFPLIIINDDRTGTYADSVNEATLRIDAAGVYALFVEAGQAYFQDDTTQIEDVFVTWADAVDHMVIAQAAVAGIQGQPLILIDDDRTGATANEFTEASLVIDAAGGYGLYLKDGQAYFADSAHFWGATVVVANEVGFYLGQTSQSHFFWDLNGAQDGFLRWNLRATAIDSTVVFMTSTDAIINAMTDHQDYASPTLVLTNMLGADANDYAGVVIGERAQADVKAAHYFDFYAMTGSIDGSATADELPAIFRFGANGTGVPTYATTGGDVLFEGEIEVDGGSQVAGYKRTSFIKWIDCFDHGSTVAKYAQDWNVTALNTQGGGTNDIDTMPSHITLTTDNNGVGDNEGTRLEETTILRSRQNRSEFSVDLGQTVNTQFYCGWNTSGTNAMVAAANEYVIVFFDVSDNANWQIKVGDGATEDVFTSAIAADTNHITHEIWVETDGTVHWAIAGTEIDITGTVDNLMDAAPHYLIVGQAQSVTGAAVIVAQICHIENEKAKL